jgi:hypothetical protein
MEGIGPVEPLIILGIFNSNWFKFNGKNASPVMARGLEEKSKTIHKTRGKVENSEERGLLPKRDTLQVDGLD